MIRYFFSIASKVNTQAKHKQFTITGNYKNHMMNYCTYNHKRTWNNLMAMLRLCRKTCQLLYIGIDWLVQHKYCFRVRLDRLDKNILIRMSYLHCLT